MVAVGVAWLYGQELPEQIESCIVPIWRPLDPVEQGSAQAEPAGGTETRRGFGNGFFVRFGAGTVLVTARHVLQPQYWVSDAHKRGLPTSTVTLRFNLSDGSAALYERALVYEGATRNVFFAPDGEDLAMLGVTLPAGVALTPLAEWLVPHASAFRVREIGVPPHRVRGGTAVVLKGCHREYPGNDRNEPITRNGAVEQLPGSRLRWQGARMRIFTVGLIGSEGLSGSPVFFAFDNGERPMLAGVLLGANVREGTGILLAAHRIKCAMAMLARDRLALGGALSWGQSPASKVAKEEASGCDW